MSATIFLVLPYNGRRFFPRFGPSYHRFPTLPTLPKPLALAFGNITEHISAYSSALVFVSH